MMSWKSQDPLVDYDGVDWSPDGPGRVSDSGNDPISLLATDKSDPSTVLSFTGLSYIITMTLLIISTMYTKYKYLLLYYHS